MFRSFLFPEERPVDLAACDDATCNTPKPTYFGVQKIGRKNAIATRSSSLPNIIARIKIYFSISSKLLKLPDGPIISPIPGPTFAKAVVAPERAVTKSNPQKASVDLHAKY